VVYRLAPTSVTLGGWFVGWLIGWLVGWGIKVPFQHKNRLYRGQVKDGQRYSNLPTSSFFLFSDNPKRESEVSIMKMFLKSSLLRKVQE